MLNSVFRIVRLVTLAASPLLLTAPTAFAQVPEQAAAPLQAPASTPRKTTAKGASAAASARAAETVTHPTWNELTAAQRTALQPLKTSWNDMDDARKRKWVAISQSYAKLPEAEQAKLQERMTEWVALSAKQRTRARLGFAETKELTPEQKEERWQAYQALSIEEKRALARSAVKPPAGAAAAVKPVPAHKMAVTPATAPASRAGAALPPKDPARHVLGSPSMPGVNRNTLLPKAPASAAKTP